MLVAGLVNPGSIIDYSHPGVTSSYRNIWKLGSWTKDPLFDMSTPEPDPGFPRRKVPVPNFPENCMKMTKIGPIARGTRLGFYYMDPPLDSKLHIYQWIFIAVRGGFRRPANYFLHIHSLFHVGQTFVLPDSFPAFSDLYRNLVHLARIWHC